MSSCCLRNRAGDEGRLSPGGKEGRLASSGLSWQGRQDIVPDETRVYELESIAFNQGPKDLPRIAYIFPIHSHQHPTQQKETVFYGSNIQGFMPTIVHPNEILDGALMFSYSAFTCLRRIIR